MSKATLSSLKWGGLGLALLAPLGYWLDASPRVDRWDALAAATLVAGAAACLGARRIERRRLARWR